MTQESLTVGLPDTLADALRSYVSVTDASATEIVTAALAEYLKAHTQTDIVRATFNDALRQHAVAFEKLVC
jgi:predicted transcriptional regulator